MQGRTHQVHFTLNLCDSVYEYVNNNWSDNWQLITWPSKSGRRVLFLTVHHVIPVQIRTWSCDDGNCRKQADSNNRPASDTQIWPPYIIFSDKLFICPGCVRIIARRGKLLEIILIASDLITGFCKSSHIYPGAYPGRQSYKNDDDKSFKGRRATKLKSKFQRDGYVALMSYVHNVWPH